MAGAIGIWTLHALREVFLKFIIKVPFHTISRAVVWGKLAGETKNASTWNTLVRLDRRSNARRLGDGSQ